MSKAIDLQSVTKIFKEGSTEFTAVNNITLGIPTGYIYGFLGPNGAGKTTIIKMICSLITPTHGEIRLNGYNAVKQRNLALQQIGAVLEGTRNIYWQLTPKQNLTYFGRLKKLWGGKLEQRIKELLYGLDLWQHRDSPVGNLSRGMQQKVAIACALVANPPIILLDEPTLGLDIQASRALQTWLETIAYEEKKTIILTTHQLDIAERLCMRIAIISQGSLIADEATQDLLKYLSQEQYQIVIQGRPEQSAHIFPEMHVTENNYETIFSGAIVDADELYRRLNALSLLKLPLISVTRRKRNLEDVFVHFMEK